MPTTLSCPFENFGNKVEQERNGTEQFGIQSAPGISGVIRPGHTPRAKAPGELDQEHPEDWTTQDARAEEQKSRRAEEQKKSRRMSRKTTRKQHETRHGSHQISDFPCGSTGMIWYVPVALRCHRACCNIYSIYSRFFAGTTWDHHATKYKTKKITSNRNISKHIYKPTAWEIANMEASLKTQDMQIILRLYCAFVSSICFPPGNSRSASISASCIRWCNALWI